MVAYQSCYISLVGFPAVFDAQPPDSARGDFSDFEANQAQLPSDWTKSNQFFRQFLTQRMRFIIIYNEIIIVII